MLSGMQLQTLAQPGRRPADPAPVPGDGEPEHSPHHPHAQTGSTPQLHP
jgi:dTMP kinase